MYTELNIGVQFKENTPIEIINAITYMASQETEQGEINFPTTHKLFDDSKGRWTWMLNSGGSYYFDAKPTKIWEFDKISGTWFLTLCTNIKNYDSEWENFLDFIAPHVDEGYIGTYRYEEDKLPTLLFIKDEKCEFCQVEVIN